MFLYASRWRWRIDKENGRTTNGGKLANKKAPPEYGGREQCFSIDYRQGGDDIIDYWSKSRGYFFLHCSLTAWLGLLCWWLGAEWVPQWQWKCLISFAYSNLLQLSLTPGLRLLVWVCNAVLNCRPPPQLGFDFIACLSTVKTQFRCCGSESVSLPED